MSSFSQLFFGAGWQFDVGSMLIGLVVGVLIVWVVRRLWPTLRRWRGRGSGWVRRSLAWMRSGAEVRFQTETIEYVQRHHLGSTWAKLDQIFVSPRVLIPPREIDLGSASDWGASQLNYLWPDLAAGVAIPTPFTIGTRELLLGRRTVVSARAGAGKTTLLAYCAYRCATASAEGKYAELYPVIPVFLHLAELNLSDLIEPDTAADQKPQDPIAPITTALQARYGPLTGPGIKGLLRRKSKGGQLLLLLDGWDELPATERPVVARWLARLLDSSPGVRVVVAASLTGYGPLLALDFAVTGLIPWRAGKMEAFAEGWKKTLSLSQSPRLGYYWRPGQSGLENSLRFWLLAISNDLDGRELERPKRWVDLLQKSVWLFSNNSKKQEDEGPDREQKPIEELTLDFWQRLAYSLLCEGKLSLTRDEVAAKLGETMAQPGVVEKGMANLLQKSLGQSNLFITWADGSISFLCTAWRDYFAAAYLAQQRSQGDIEARLTDPDWKGTLHNYVSLAGAAEFATKLLAIKEQGLTRDQLFRVSSWMAEAPDGGEWRRQTMILLGQIIRQGTFAYVLRQRAAASLVQTSEPGILTFVTQLLERSDPFFRQLGTIALSHLGTDKAVELLTGLLKDGDSEVRQAAVYSLAWLPPKKAEQPLLMALIQGDDRMSRIAAEGLAQSGSEGMEILKEAIEDEDVRVRRAAIHGLELIDEPWVVPLLISVERSDTEWLVRSAATEAVERIKARDNPTPWHPLPLSEKSWLVQHAAEQGRTVPKGAAALPFLVQILTESTSPEQRIAAAASLGQIAAQDALPALETAVRDPDKRVSEAAFTTLCQIRRAQGSVVPVS